MIALLLLLLLAVWAAVLLPPWIRGRAEHSPQHSIAGFHRRLSVLAGRSGGGRPLPGFSTPIPVIPPPLRHDGSLARPVYGRVTQSAAQLRRTRIFQGLAGGAAGTLVLSFLPPLSFFVYLFVLDLVALIGYVVLLLQWKRDRNERTQKVRTLPQADGRAPRPVRAVPSLLSLERQAR